jgi:hypothetical protein
MKQGIKVEPVKAESKQDIGQIIGGVRTFIAIPN